MKLIVKGTEPADFTEWKNSGNEDWQPRYDDLRGTIKQNLHAALLKEQGFICCYCESRIIENESHIEHLKPRSKPDFTYDELNYFNMLASCLRETKCGDSVHCGHRKSDWFDEDLMVSPFDPRCEMRFGYSAHGGIYPAEENDYGARETINHLHLDIKKLRDMRRKAIDAVISNIDVLTEGDIKNLIAGYKEKHEDGTFPPYCTTIIYTLVNLSKA